MKERRFDLYGNVRCLYCNIHFETQEHLFVCTGLFEQWEQVRRKCVDDSVASIDNSQRKVIMSNETKSALIYWLRYILFNNFQTPIFSDYTLDQLLLKSFFPKFKVDELAAILGNNKEAKYWGILIIRHFSMAFRDLIWKPRCDKVKKWEKDNNITLKEIKNRPSSDKYIKYSQTLTHDIDGCTYDHKN